MYTCKLYTQYTAHYQPLDLSCSFANKIFPDTSSFKILKQPSPGALALASFNVMHCPFRERLMSKTLLACGFFNKSSYRCCETLLILVAKKKEKQNLSKP